VKREKEYDDDEKKTHRKEIKNQNSIKQEQKKIRKTYF
jgi:hypothetical protein